MQDLLKVANLHISVDSKEIIHGINLNIGEGEIHAIMGPNGSGKSTLVNTLMGHPKFSVTEGTALLNRKDLLTMEPHERAKAGLFLAFQYPKEIAGVSLRSFLFAAYKATVGAPRGGAHTQSERLSPIAFKKLLDEKMHELHMDPAFAERSVNQGFSGGEKKKAEILQLAILKPRLALLDETDSGLDIDALKTVADGVNRMRSTKFSAIIVTHYARLLEYVKPDFIHVMVQGKIVESGDATLAKKLEKKGYTDY
jgi:Fe-S cluster assembly ATP-binding protein